MIVQLPPLLVLSLSFAVGTLSTGTLFPWSSMAMADQPTVDFARDIRPILSDRCFTCHGPDGNRRATDLRLDQRESALEHAISLDSPADSQLLERIDSDDPDSVMPPPDSKLTLSDREKQLLRDWVAGGAPYSEHWAFSSVERPVVPTDSLAEWAANPIDHFVAQRLTAEGLSPAEPAQPAMLLRRLALDLTGLPPSVEEQREFAEEWQAASQAGLAAGSSAASSTGSNPAVTSSHTLTHNDPEQLAVVERWVDRYLASARFGERMAVDWLDVARYADTYGYQADRYRAMWPWRDWVIQAFNDNLPYDQFVRWQLAGDLLPEATREQLIATAFNRHHRQTNEGGSVEEEYRAEYVADRVNTFGAAFLGLTLECCRCHDHKYDPLTQQEYYQLSAFFNNIDESGLYSHFTDATPTPTVRLSTSDQEQRIVDLEKQIAALEQQRRAVQLEQPAFAAWRQQLTAESLDQRLKKGLLADYGFDAIDGGKLANRVADGAVGGTSESPELVAGVMDKALRFSGENNATFSAGGAFTRDQAFSIAVWIKSPERFPRAVVLHRSRAWTDSGSRGYELLIEEGRLSVGLIHFWPGNAIRIVAEDELALNTWTHVVINYDGSSRADGLQLFVDGRLAPTEVVRDQLTRAIHGGEANELALAQRFRDVGFKNGEIDELKVYGRSLTPAEIALMHWKESQPQQGEEDHLGGFLASIDDAMLQDVAIEQHAATAEQIAALTGQLADLRKQRSDVVESIPEIMVMREMSDQRSTFVLQRGAYDAPGEEVERGVLAKLSPGLSNVERPSRLDLANWLTDPQHPLTARVFVNRLWQSLYGAGIVATAEDFGLQGAAPTHPELLDWLAAEFIESGWNVKRLVKLMVMSSTYRQTSDVRPEVLERDPENRLLARGPVHRLSAEMLRDSALFASGLLVDKLGGPPVKPYQPEGLWEEKSGETYHRDVGEGSHRRSLYTFWKRTSPPPAMMTFDASNREVCVVRRQVTSTPLQVLVMLNDPQMVEAAVALAARTLQANSAEPASVQVAAVFRALCNREPSAKERSILASLLDEQLIHFSGREEDAKQFVSVGDFKPPEDMSATQLAALASVAQALMNYDEFMMKR